MINLRKVLVATDFGEPSAAALTYGRELARRFGAALTVLHVADNVLGRGFDTYLGVPDLQKDIEASAHQHLDTLLTDEDRRQLGAQAVVVTSNNTAFEIALYARAADIDLIVMGTHGRSGVAQLFIGGVAERVVRIAPCPVLTVHHPEHEFIMPDALDVVRVPVALQTVTTTEERIGRQRH